MRRLFPLVLAVVLAVPAYSSADGGPGRSRNSNSGKSGQSGRSGSSGKSGASRAPVDRLLRDSSHQPGKARVIVQYRPGARRNVVTQVAGTGGRVLRDHQLIDAITVELPRAAIEHLARVEDVLALSSDALVSSEQLLAGQDSGSDLGGQSILQGQALTSSSSLGSSFDAQALRSTLGIEAGNTGAGVGIAIVDSGIEPATDLQGRIAAFYDFTKGGIAAAPYDDYGHGTHIAGLIAGNGQQSKARFVGVATSARLIGLKVLDAQGMGYSSDVISAIDFAITNRAALGIDVLNLSLGHPIYESAATDPLVRAVGRAVAAGIVVVASAGNHGMDDAGRIGYAGITSPGNAPSALTAGALRTRATATRLDDEVAAFSSRGPTWYDGLSKPDVLAPGQALVAINASGTTLYENMALRADVAPYLRLSGTSMAAGVTSGVVALLIQANRLDEGASSVLTPNVIKAILQYTSIAVADPDPGTPAMLEQGAGAINAAGAIALTRAIDPDMPQGSSWLETAIEPFTLLGGVPQAWVQHIVWGDHLIWGDTIAWNLDAWDEHIVWGDGDEHIVWGDDEHIVWGDGDSSSWSGDEHIVWGDAFFQSPSGVLESFSAWIERIVWGDFADVFWYDEHIVWGDLSVNRGY